MVAKGLPSVSVEASQTRRDLAGPGQPGVDKSVYLVLRHNFYTGGADSAREDQSREKLSQSEEDLRAAKREAEKTFAQAMLEANSMESLIKSRLKAVELSADSLRMVREQFAYRRGSLLDLLTAQETLNSAGRDLIDAQIDSAQAKYKVLYSASLLNKFFSLE
jgi:adhesin transport system outer membrane protein